MNTQRQELEQRVAGGLLASVHVELCKNPGAFLDGFEARPNDFEDPKLRKLVTRIIQRVKEGQPVSELVLVEDGFTEDFLIAAESQGAGTSHETQTFASRLHEQAQRESEIRIATQAIGELQAGKVTLKKYRHDLAERVKEAEREDAGSRLAAFSSRDLLSMEIKPREYLLEPIIAEQSATMIYGWRGTGKSKVAHGIAVAAATGGRFLRWQGHEPRRVVAIDGELPAGILREWIAQAIAAVGREPADNLTILAHDLQPPGVFLPDISTREGQDRIDPFVEGAALVVVDNLASLCRNGVENERESWVPMQEWILNLRKRGTATLIVHHANKKGGQRGTSAREDAVDTVLALSRPDGYRPEEGARFVVKFEKSRGLLGTAVEPFEAQLTTDDNGAPSWTIKSTASTSEDIVELAQSGMSRSEIQKYTGRSKSWVCRVLADAKKRGDL